MSTWQSPADMQVSRVADIRLTWGESLCWDDLLQRLYFVDCASQKLYWLDQAQPPLQHMQLPSLPTGIGLAQDGRIVIALDDGFHLIDADRSSNELLTPYPQGIGRRANDASIDPAGNIVTGSLNPAGSAGIGTTPPGSYWRYSTRSGWQQLDDNITNANGPVCLPPTASEEAAEQAQCTLVFADTPTQSLLGYTYNSEQGQVSNRHVFADTAALGGYPDGACATDQGGVLSCVLGGGVLAYFQPQSLAGTIRTTAAQPSDVCFAGADLQQIFVVSINADIGRGAGKPTSPWDGCLLQITGSGLRGLPEHRLKLS